MRLTPDAEGTCLEWEYQGEWGGGGGREYGTERVSRFMWEYQGEWEDAGENDMSGRGA
jgi:hypothetical protein